MIDHLYYNYLDKAYKILAECSENFYVYKRMATIEESQKLYSMDSFDCISSLNLCHYELDDYSALFLDEDENMEEVNKFLTAIDRLQEDIIELAANFVIHATEIKDDYCLINLNISHDKSARIKQLNINCDKCREYVKNLLFEFGF